MFKVLKYNPTLDRKLKESGLEETTYFLMNNLNSMSRVIEGVDTTKYNIGGYPTATFLVIINNTDKPKDILVSQTFLVNVLGKIWFMTYQDTADNFDSKLSQQTLNKILTTFRFLKS